MIVFCKTSMRDLARRADNNKPHYYILTGSFDNTVINRVPEFPVMPSYKLPDGFTCPNGCVLQVSWTRLGSTAQPQCICTVCRTDLPATYPLPLVSSGCG